MEDYKRNKNNTRPGNRYRRYNGNKQYWNNSKNRNFDPNRGDFTPNSKYRYPRSEPYQKVIPKKTYKTNKVPSRPSSPVEGSEEYMNKKIKKTSAIIMRQLLSPEENIILPQNPNPNTIASDEAAQTSKKSNLLRKKTDTVLALYQTEKTQTNRAPQNKAADKSESIPPKNHSDKLLALYQTSNSTKPKNTYNIAEIQNKIMSHICNLNDGRKKNLISNSTSVYDEAIRQICQQKRLEISRALRSVCLKSDDVNQSSELINSIIPDMGIKIEDLPQELLEELENTFSKDENFEDLTGEILSTSQSAIEIKDEPVDFQANMDVVQILESDILMPTDEIKVEDNITNNFPAEEYNESSIDEETAISGSKVNNQPLGSIPQNFYESIPFEENTAVNVENYSTNLEVTNNNNKETGKLTIDDFLKRNFKKPPKSYAQAIKRMMTIDNYVSKLIEYRQNIFLNIRDKNKKRNKNQSSGSKSRSVGSEDDGSTSVSSKNVSLSNCNDKNDDSRSILSEEIQNNINTNFKFDFSEFQEKVLVLKVYENTLLAATESGKIYFYDLKESVCSHIIIVTTQPITSLLYKTQEENKPYLFIGTSDSYLKVYNIYSKSLVKSFILEDSIQCMDENWGYLFLGCLRGTIIRYSLKKQEIEYEERFSPYPILVIKAISEGARRVLLIGSRNSPVYIRDAMSGLYLRKLEIMYPTVYSMILHKNYVICGTTTSNILVFNFHTGNLEYTFKSMTEKTVSCMKAVGNCLFACCHNGKVYIFNLQNHQLIETLSGPGGPIVSMEVLTNQIIVGTLTFKLDTIPISQNILSHMS